MKYLVPVFAMMLLAVQATASEITPQHKLLKNATSVLEEVLSTPDVEIPQKMLAKARAVVVFPTMMKAGFIGAMRYGKGVASVRDSKTGKWGPPSFVTTIGGSVGFQAGAQAVDLVLLVMSERGVNGLLQNQFTLGSDLAVTAGPVGRYAEAGFDIMLQGDVYSYSRSKGIFAGISLKGTVIKPNYEYNKEYYRQDLTPEDIMMHGGLKAIPESTKRFMRDFNRMAPPPSDLKTLAALEGEVPLPLAPKSQPARISDLNPPPGKPVKPLW